MTCKINERTALSSPRLARAMEQANAVYLVGDWTRRDDAITRELERHGRSGVPLYLLYRPGQAEPRIASIATDLSARAGADVVAAAAGRQQQRRR